MNVSGTTISATGHKGGLGDGLYDKAGARPDLDLDFARTKSLKDRVSKEDLITFTRSSGTGYGATYVDGNGLVKRSPVNWIFDSEDLSTGTYSIYGDFEGAVSANAGTSPSGNSSYAYIGQGTTGRHTLAIRPPAGNNNFLIANNTRFVISFFIKRLSGDSVERYVNIETANYSTWTHTGNSGRFDLETGTRVTDPTNSNITSGIEDVGDGWYRIHMSSITDTTTNSTGFYLNSTHSTSNGAPSVTLTSSQGYLVWGVQVEEGSVPTTYIPTSAQRRGAPRFTHDPETLESKGLLIEQTATNVIANKNADSTDWTKTGISISSTLRTAPTGVNEANELVATIGNTDTKQMYHTTSSSNISALKYTFSVFLKKGAVVDSNDVSKALIKIGQSGTKANAEVDLTNGTINVTTGTGAIENYGNGWYRASVTTAAALSASAACNSFVLVLKANGQNTYTGAGESIYFYGPQLEAGEITTSYIPTSGQANGVTRSPDLVSIEGDNFGTYRKNLITNTSFRKGSDGWLNANSTTLEPYAAASPFGTYDAGKLTATNPSSSGSAQHQFKQNLTLETSVKYSASIYVKAGNHKIGRLGITWNDGSSNTFNVVSFNLTEGYVDGNNRPNQGFTTGAITSSSVTPVGNGWFRVQMVSQTTASTIASANVAVSFLDNSGIANFTANNEDFFIWGLQVVKADTNSEFIPSTDEYTNRQSDATFVDGNGIIRHSRANKLQNTSTLSTPWSGENLDVTASSEVTPDGDTTAKKVTKNITNSNNFARYRHLNNNAGFVNVVHTTSVYVKADGLRYLHFRHGNQNGGFGTAFDLQEGTILAQGYRDNNILLATPISSAIEDAGNGWYRCSITSLLSDLTMWFGVSNSATVTNATDDEGGSMHFWHPQTVKGTEIIPFIPTVGTNTPAALARYSHDPDTLTPTGLYLEPKSTNYLQSSSNFNIALSNGGWAHATSPTPRISYDNNIANPDGSIGAAYLNNNGSETYAYFDTTQYDADDDGSPDGTDTVTISCFVKAKANETDKLILQLYLAQSNTLSINLGWILRFDPNANNGEGSLDMHNPSRTVDGSTVTLGTSSNSIIEKYQNGWFRIGCTVQVNPVTEGGVTYSTFQSVARFDIQSRYNNQDGNDGKHYFWGPQIEVGDNITSYIPTSGATATRSADTFTSTATEVLDKANGTKPAFYTKNGLTTFTNGIVTRDSIARRFFEFGTPATTMTLATATTGTRAGIYQPQPSGSSAGTTTPNVDLSADDNKIAVRYAENDLMVCTNGTLGTVDGDIDTRSPTTLFIGKWYISTTAGQDDRHLQGTINRLTIWKTPFTDSKLQRLTS